MATKINKISISGLRGVYNPMEFSLLGKSILLYGDNGSGKSSLSDAFEWFFTGEVRHLAGSEIDLKEALRNTHLSDDENSIVQFSFSTSDFDNIKSISKTRGRLSTANANNSSSFVEYINQTKKENFILRHQFLTDFINMPKGEKLKSLSDIIGYAEVNKTKEILKRTYNSVKSELRSQNYETQINLQKQILVEKIGAAVSVEGNFFERLSEIIRPTGIKLDIKSMSDVDVLLEILRNQVNQGVIEELRYLENCNNILTNLHQEILLINDAYSKFHNEFKSITDDVDSLKQILLGELLKRGKEVIENKYLEKDFCPLCLQSKKLEDLLEEIGERLNKIREATTQKTSFETAKKSVINITLERLVRLRNLEHERLYKEDRFSNLKSCIEGLINKVNEIKRNADHDITSKQIISAPNEVNINESDFFALEEIALRIITIQNTLSSDDRTLLFSNISASKEAFLRIGKFEKEKSILESQQYSLGQILNELIKRHKEELEGFITEFSGLINEFYQFMNPSEQFQELKIVTLGDEEELKGITVEYQYNDRWVSPPQKFFSESHLNCFGLSFFLASVVAFNKENQFILFDDVISSFDSDHRKRFADLLFEKFSDSQIILMTHEYDWFQYIQQLAKRKQWLINEIKWNEKEGTYLEREPETIKERIESNIAAGNIEIIGNLIRRYLESILKEICTNMKVKVDFRYNNLNEKRMPDELLNELISKINKHSNDLKAKRNIFDRVIISNILSNILSHDNPYNRKHSASHVLC